MRLIGEKRFSRNLICFQYLVLKTQILSETNIKKYRSESVMSLRNVILICYKPANHQSHFQSHDLKVNYHSHVILLSSHLFSQYMKSLIYRVSSCLFLNPAGKAKIQWVFQQVQSLWLAVPNVQSQCHLVATWGLSFNTGFSSINRFALTWTSY